MLAAGKHYKVEFTNEKRKCQCIDHRIRKHDCKHIRLMLKTMGIEAHPQEWPAAAHALVTAQAATLGIGRGDAIAKAAEESAGPTKAQAAAQAFL